MTRGLNRRVGKIRGFVGEYAEHWRCQHVIQIERDHAQQYLYRSEHAQLVVAIANDLATLDVRTDRQTYSSGGINVVRPVLRIVLCYQYEALFPDRTPRNRFHNQA